MSELQGMVLEKLKIERETYGVNKGKYNGTMTFSGQSGDITIKIDEEHCAKMFAIVADGVLDTAREVAEGLKRECMIGYAKQAQLVTE